MGEILYNGIELPDVWPPCDVDLENTQPIRVPYLDKMPDVVPIDLGRQLFVDDFLLDAGTNMDRRFGKPAKYPANPVFHPETRDERDAEYPPCAVAKSGGVWHDGGDGLFKMWYMSGYLGHASFATSTDGVHWTRPALDVVPGTNHVLPRDVHPDSGSVVIDYEAPPAEKFKMLVREPDADGATRLGGHLYVSGDGAHWREIGRTGRMDDRSTMFYNPFRKRWVQSIRSWRRRVGRSRFYYESPDFRKSGTDWPRYEDTAPWMRADCLDEAPGGELPQLYNLDAIAYESVMLGFPQLLKGPPNPVGERLGAPKWTDLTAAYSRDGFHWFRPDRSAFIGARREPGSWEYGYVESSAGMCLVVGDELWLYYSAYGGDGDRPASRVASWHLNGTYANGAVGLAKLRRDGFAYLCARFKGAQTVTRPLRFRGSRLFVNANTVGSRLTAEVRGLDDRPVPGYGAEDALPFIGNKTKAELRWKTGDLSRFAGQPVKFRFRMDRGELYSFWVTDSANGASGGYVGGGGPGFKGGRDMD